MTSTPCPSCRRPKGPGKYLCSACWFTLPQPARRALNRRDRQAMGRLRQLHRQLAAGVPLDRITVAACPPRPGRPVTAAGPRARVAQLEDAAALKAAQLRVRLPSRAPRPTPAHHRGDPPR